MGAETGVAQGQRAWLITTRSLDRNGLPVSFNSRVYKNLSTLSPQQPFTGMAQRERAGLITPRSLVRTQFPVSFYSLFRYSRYSFPRIPLISRFPVTIRWCVSFSIHPRADPDKWPVCEMLILLLFFSVEWLFSLFVLVQLLKCCEHRRASVPAKEGCGMLNVFFVFYIFCFRGTYIPLH